MDTSENEMVEVTVDTVTVPGGGDGGGGSGGGWRVGAEEEEEEGVEEEEEEEEGGVPLSAVEPRAKPHRVMEHAPPLHMSALTNVHASEAAPAGTLVDCISRVVMLELKPLIVAQVVAELPVQ
ncbi:hypothetical protein CYMTET_32555 [Cymbomonas tetramitiformis]|uniref:Uncharacterized protein n=1 Tax=Cymbomonas tetramitiformis TaxID=36881 RepID=A0AAE0KS28_9CHLO|nr:hypothetical protein CYMTET_32555 [Cymbomonas tetramitiformis]